MKLTTYTSHIKYLTLLLGFIVIGSGIAYGVVNYSEYFPNGSAIVQSESNGWTTPVSGNTKEIRTPEGCRKITSSQGTMMFAPTRTMAEWVSFRDHLPSGVSQSLLCNNTMNYTTSGYNGWQGTAVGIHARCVITNIWSDWNDKTQYSLGGSYNTAWSIGISDEGNNAAAYANVMCTDVTTMGNGDGDLCTHLGLPGISKGGGCYVGIYYSDRYSTYLNDISNSVSRPWGGVSTPP